MENQTLVQKKIALAQSEHAGTIIEIIKDCLPQNSLLADDEFHTLVNAITLDAHSTLLRRVVDYLEEIRKGTLHEG